MTRKETWMRPEGETVKINFDAAFDEKTGKKAWGFVVRSSSGEFMAAGAGKLSHLCDALQAETEAYVAAIEGAVRPYLNLTVRF
jgi:ribonuclease HI